MSDLPEWIQGQTRTAAFLSSHLGIPCTKFMLRDWIKRQPPFPSPTPDGRYPTQSCIEWVRTHIIAKIDRRGRQDLDIVARGQIAESETKITKAARERRQLEILEGKFVEKALAERTIIGALKKYHAIVRAELERQQTAELRRLLEQLGVDAKPAAKILEFQLGQARALVDRVETECAKFATETTINTQSYE